MPNPDVITSNAVATLLSGASSDVCYVQVLVVTQRSSLAGVKKYNISISDGVHQLDCVVAPQMFFLLESNAIEKYSIVSIQRALVSEVCGCTKVVIVDMLPVSKQSVVIGTPMLGDSNLKRQSSDSPVVEDSLCNKKNCAFNVRNTLREVNEDSESAAVVDANDGNVSAEVCQSCNMSPCDWLTYGPGILSHLNNNYVGFYMNEDGNVVHDQVDKATAIKNWQLHFLAYSAFTSAKHGYLGKKNHTSLPLCVQNGIRDQFPDVDKNYVSFRASAIDE
jgi:hypothetical protein